MYSIHIIFVVWTCFINEEIIFLNLSIIVLAIIIEAISVLLPLYYCVYTSVPTGGYNTLFNATQYEFCVNASAPVGTIVFTAQLIMENTRFCEVNIEMNGTESEFSSFSLNGTGHSYQFVNPEIYYYREAGDDVVNIVEEYNGTVMVQIVVSGELDENRTYQFELRSSVEYSSSQSYDRSVDIIIHTRGEYYMHTVLRIL